MAMIDHVISTQFTIGGVEIEVSELSGTGIFFSTAQPLAIAITNNSGGGKFTAGLRTSVGSSAMTCVTIQKASPVIKMLPQFIRQDSDQLPTLLSTAS